MPRDLRGRATLKRMRFPDLGERGRRAGARLRSVLAFLLRVLARPAARGRRALPGLAIGIAVLVPAIGAGTLLARAGGSGSPVGAAATGPTGPTGVAAVSVPVAAPVPATVAVAPLSAATGPAGGAATASAPPPGRAGPSYYRQTTTRVVPVSAEAGFVPLYREAGRAYGVAWQLVASIHRQETAFSTEPSTYRGRNAYGCCAGPMQFNLTNGPVSTWTRYKQAFRRGTRPAAYPHPTRSHPSIYDDFDAIMAAAALLRDAGAGARLDGGAWLAAYAYYGHDEFGVTYADQVVGRAQGWARGGFCVNCADDPGRVQALEDAYGGHERGVLRAGPANHARTAREREARRRAARVRRARAAAQARRTAAGARAPKAAPPARAGSSAPARKHRPAEAPRGPAGPTPSPSGATAAGAAACPQAGCPG